MKTKRLFLVCFALSALVACGDDSESERKKKEVEQSVKDTLDRQLRQEACRVAAQYGNPCRD